MAKKIKTYILMLSREFPKTHPRAGEPTDFMSKKEADVKIHTIRNNVALWEHRAEEINAGRAVLSVRQWSGKPYEPGSHQIEIARHTALVTQRISFPCERLSVNSKLYPLWGEIIDNDGCHAVIDLEKIAANDGLTVDDFKEWFAVRSKDRKAVLERVILHFTDKSYDYFDSF